MKKRIYIAIPISQDLQYQVTAWQKPWLGLPVRWVPVANLHVTLIPPWYEEVANVGQVIEQLCAVVNTVSPFTLNFDQIVYGPNSQEPRYLWAVSNDFSGVVDLQTKLARAFGEHAPTRPFTPHMTLARLPKTGSTAVERADLRGRIAWDQMVRSVVLLESRFTSRGVKYEVIQEGKLQGDSS